ncbi:MAG TPA: hypothetical protein HA362_00920 [Nanoarchaeota archaeon]|nr:hypothetical protein [Nanoarchaeota archaeon]
MNKNLRTGLAALVIAGVASISVGTDGCNRYGAEPCNKDAGKCSYTKPAQSEDNRKDMLFWIDAYTLLMH